MTDTNRVLETYERNGGAKNRALGTDFATNPAQTGNSFSGLSVTTRVVDMHKMFINAGVFDVNVVNGTFTGRKSLKINTTTAVASPAATDIASIANFIEGYDIIPLTLQPFYVSGEIASNVTGKAAIAIGNSIQDRVYVHEIDILISNQVQTFGFEVPAIPVDAGTWDVTNGIGLTVQIANMAGSAHIASAADQWITSVGNDMILANTVNRAANINDYIEIDRLQVEPGRVGTFYESLLIGNVLNLLERYYEKSYNVETVPGTITSSGAAGSRLTVLNSGVHIVENFIPFRVPKRVAPLNTVYSITTGASGVVDTNTGVKTATFIGTNGKNGFGISSTDSTTTDARRIFHYTSDARF